VTFTDILQDNHVEFFEEGHHHCRPGWVQMDCPFCGRGSQRYHMGYNLKSGYLHCWKCGPHRMAETLAELLEIDVKKAFGMLKGVERGGGPRTVEKHRGTLVMPKGVGPLLPAHRRYLEGRGFDPDALAAEWGVQGIGLASRLQWRLFIPITFQEQVVSFTTRAISEDAELRYVSASAQEEAMNHKEILYGEDHCRHACCLVEGPISAWGIGHGGAATCGTGFTQAQLNRFARFPVRGVCFDAEPAAQRRAREVVDQMSVFPGETYNFVLDHGKDPASNAKTRKEALLIRKTLGL
jgi:hypothetical protein